MLSPALHVFAVLPAIKRDHRAVRDRMQTFLEGASARICVSDKISEAVVLAEDRRFRSHKGVDGFAIMRAAAQYALHRKISGASTIEQQLVRTWRRRYELSIARKFTEVVIASLLASEFEKDEILSAYLDCAYFGWNATGVTGVSRRLGIDPARASTKEAATIAAMLKLPMPRYPSSKYAERLATRVNYILRQVNCRDEGDAKNF